MVDKQKMKRVATLLLPFLFLAINLPILGIPEISLAQEEKKYIRILVAKNIKEFRLYLKGKYEIHDFKKGVLLLRGKTLNTKIYISSSGIKIKDNYFRQDSLIIYPRVGYFYLNKRPLRGRLIIKKDNNSKFLLINYLDLESYVRGVLFNEVSHRWPMEALKAQAIVTRTYALYHMLMNKDKEYDLTCDMYAQVYGGINSERYRTNKAVNLTRGLILTYRGDIFPTYFHATCGGMTEDAHELWNIDILPLKGVICPFCKKSPHFRWQRSFKVSEILEKLNTFGYKLERLDSIQIIERDKSDRIRRLKLIVIGDKENDKSDQITISGKDFRQLVGPNQIRSTNFDVEFKNGRVNFSGFGWGHGVGLCQWGAYFMSRKKYKCEAILQFYYPGSKIEKI
jgi:stage II sporulation protein D